MLFKNEIKLSTLHGLNKKTEITITCMSPFELCFVPIVDHTFKTFCLLLFILFN